MGSAAITGDEHVDLVEGPSENIQASLSDEPLDPNSLHLKRIFGDPEQAACLTHWQVVNRMFMGFVVHGALETTVLGL